MKKAIIRVGICLLLTGNSAFANGDWHTVLSCDGGAAVIDNRNTLTVGRDQLPATTAQIVIRNPQIVQYFSNSLAMENGYSDGYRIINDQWISSLVPQVTYPAGSVVTSFTIRGIYGSQAQIKYDGTGLSVNVVNDHNQSANWFFRNCVRR